MTVLNGEKAFLSWEKYMNLVNFVDSFSGTLLGNTKILEEHEIFQPFLWDICAKKFSEDFLVPYNGMLLEQDIFRPFRWDLMWEEKHILN